MNIHERIRKLMHDQQWTTYKISKESGLSQSTISNMFSRNTVPSIATLEAICDCFGITLSQFFAEGELVELNEEQQQLFGRWLSLTPEQKGLVNAVLDAMATENKKED